MSDQHKDGNDDGGLELEFRSAKVLQQLQHMQEKSDLPVEQQNQLKAIASSTPSSLPAADTQSKSDKGKPRPPAGTKPSTK